MVSPLREKGDAEPLRFEDRRRGADRFCTLQRSQSELHVVFGRRGHSGTARVETYDNPKMARRRMNQRMRSLEARGYVRGAINPELFDRVCESAKAEAVGRPLSEGVYRAYASWLAQHNDPRAELVEAGLTLIDDPQNAAASATWARLLREHPHTLGVASLCTSEQLRWHAGFVRSATFVGFGDLEHDHHAAAGRLRRFLRHPSVGLLQFLELEASYHMIEEVLLRYAPPTLERVVISPTVRIRQWIKPGRNGRYRVSRFDGKVELVCEEEGDVLDSRGSESPSRGTEGGSQAAGGGDPTNASCEKSEAKGEQGTKAEPLSGLKSILARLERLLLG